MKMLEKKANQYIDPLLVGIAPRTVQERKLMSKSKMLGGGIGAGLGYGFAALNPNNKLPEGAVRFANATGGAIIGSIIGNYAAHKRIADQRRSLGQQVYNENDIGEDPIVSINGQIVG